MNPDTTFHTALHGDPIDALPAIRQARELLDQAQHDHIMTLRRHGASWGFIARHLGITRQSARQHYGPWEPPTQT